MKKYIIFTLFVFLKQVQAQQVNWVSCISGSTESFFCTAMLSESVFYVGGKNGTLLKSSDYGNTFETLATGNQEDIQAIHFLDNNVGFLLQDVNLYKTTNAGQNWLIAHVFNEVPLAFHFLTNQDIYISCENGEAYKSNDGGQTFIAMNTASNRDLYAIGFSNQQIGYAGGKNNTSLYTTNAGASFTSNMIPDNEDIFDIYFANPNSAWACGTGGTVYHTSNANGPWVSQTAPSQNDFESVFIMNNSIGWICGNGGIILKTSDGGNNWMDENNSINKDLFEVHAFDSIHAIVVGDAGTILKLELSNQQAIIENGKMDNLFTLYPCPADNYLTIKPLQLDTKINTISLTNIHGAQVCVNKSISTNYEPIVYIENLNPGYYFVEIVCNYGKYYKALIIE